MLYGVREKMWVFFSEPSILRPFIWKTRSIDLLLLAISGRVMPSQSSNKRVTRIQPVTVSIGVWHRFMTNFHSLWIWPRFSPRVREGGTPYDGLHGKAPPERGIFFRLQVYERVGISLVEVYIWVGKSVIWVCERAQKSWQMNVMAL